MFELKLDVRAFEQMAWMVGDAADHLPFVISRSLNTAAEKTRDTFIKDTWPSHVQVRSKSFLAAALTTRGERATKSSLKVTLYDKLNRGNLALHNKGGVKVAKGKLALPDRKIKGRRGAKGMPAGLRPKALPNSFRRGDVIYQRAAKGRRLKLMYTLKSSAPIKADVPFTSEFERVMRRELTAAFPAAMREAMRTRRPR